jgi:hypothetical protein
MTSIDCNWEVWGKEGEDGRSDPRSASGVRQISRSGEELLADCKFLSGETLALSGKPIAFSHIISKTADVSLQSRVAEVSNGSVDKAATGVSGGEDLKGVVSKEPGFGKVWSGARVCMEIAEVDPCYWTLTSFYLWIERLCIIPDPLAGISYAFFFVVDSGGLFGEWIVPYPSQGHHPLVVLVHDLSVITLLRTVDIGAG